MVPYDEPLAGRVLRLELLDPEPRGGHEQRHRLGGLGPARVGDTFEQVVQLV